MVAIAQAELISDDPRDPSKGGMWADIRHFIDVSRECGGLITVGQASKILGVNSGQVSVWASRGRIKSTDVLGTKMVSAGEVLALHRERQEGVQSVGGRGHKSASLADMAVSAWKDIDPLK
jgi:hypothetical protein